MKTKFERLGTSTLEVEVTNISNHGFWLLLDTEEVFVPFDQFPWFKNASIDEILHVELPHAGHLYWPDLDVDIAVESIHHPDRFPLVSRPRPNKSLQRTRPRAPRSARRPAARR
jgi:hypothetical protein